MNPWNPILLLNLICKTNIKAVKIILVILETDEEIVLLICIFLAEHQRARAWVKNAGAYRYNSQPWKTQNKSESGSTWVPRNRFSQISKKGNNMECCRSQGAGVRVYQLHNTVLYKVLLESYHFDPSFQVQEAERSLKTFIAIHIVLSVKKHFVTWYFLKADGAVSRYSSLKNCHILFGDIVSPNSRIHGYGLLYQDQYLSLITSEGIGFFQYNNLYIFLRK